MKDEKKYSAMSPIEWAITFIIIAVLTGLCIGCFELGYYLATNQP